MATDRDDERLYDHERRISSLESWRDNQQAQRSVVPAWVIGILSLAVAGASLLANILLSRG